MTNEKEGWGFQRCVNPVEVLVLFEQKGYYHHRILRSHRSNLLTTTTILFTELKRKERSNEP